MALPRHAVVADSGQLTRQKRSLGVRLDGLLDLLLDGFQVETRALLHRRKLDRSLGELRDLLLHELETPELVSKPVAECQGTLNAAGQARAVEGIQADISEDRPTNIDRAAQQTAWLLGETIHVVGDAYCTQCALGEVEHL